MRAMKDSGVEWIGEIPQEWDIKKFKYFFDIIGGNGFKDEFQGNETGEIPFCKASDINGSGKYVSIAKNFVSYELANLQKYNIIPINSILIPKIGEALRKNHRKINTVPCIVDNNCEAFRMNRNDNINYLYYVMKHIDMDWFDNGGTIPSVNNSKLREFYFPFPNVSVQENISTYLDEKCSKIDSLIEKQKAVIEKLKEYKLSVITEAVTKGLNPDVEIKDSGIEWIGAVPKNWTVYKLKYLLKKGNDSIRVGPFGSQLTTKDYVADGVWVYTQRNVLDEDFVNNNTFITTEKFNSMISFAVEQDDILVTTRGTGTTGHIVKVPTGFPVGIIHPCLMKFKLDESKCIYKFLYYVFEYAKYLRTQIDVANNTSSLPVLYSNTLCNLNIVIPSKEIQCDLVEWIDSKSKKIDCVIKKKQNIIERLLEYKKSLIYEVVTGKKEV